MRKILAGLILLLAASLPAAGQRLLPDPAQSLLPIPIQGITSWTVDGDSVHLTISLPGGLHADLTLAFEDVVGLNLSNLGISARLVNPWDLSLLARLQGLLGTSLLSGFPVLLRIEPPASGGLAFSGIASFELHTNIIHYTPGCPLRLFAASLGGPFRDVTTNMGAGSYRVRGSRGGFSEFLIVADLRPVDQVITGKLDRLEDMLEDYEGSMPGSVYDDLEALLADIRADHAGGATAAAIEGVDDFLAIVEQHAGTSIPNVWRSARDVENVAGYLRAGAMTLRFSLALKQGSGFGF
jgi:hypothetical protein